MAKIDQGLWTVLQTLHDNTNYGGNLGGQSVVQQYLDENDPQNGSEDEDDGYESRTKAQLQAEIDNRNSSREFEDQIEPDGETKASLVAALRKDDENEQQHAQA